MYQLYHFSKKLDWADLARYLWAASIFGATMVIQWRWLGVVWQGHRNQDYRAEAPSPPPPQILAGIEAKLNPLLQNVRDTQDWKVVGSKISLFFFPLVILKFIYSEKATKFCEIFP